MRTATDTLDVSEPEWFDQAEPTFADLDAIEIEWPAIEAELLELERELSGPAPERLVAFDIDCALGDTLAPGFATFSLN
ncbi:DUF6284 family protein [Glycomyces paridis]|uniref:Uncharacterized protein n=1 Tax=Glycomyces paridis TaxID=2126555 RepID=A0A4S8PGL8_9ACTN|nr:DUF6284 family protein [Glycomyces paridis]THV29650.1 hypothetical protein E9998_09205 [Glycomyces paridis]